MCTKWVPALTPAHCDSASQRRRKNTNCRGQPLHGQGIVEHNVSSSQEKAPWLGRTSQETLGEPLQHRARKKNFSRRPFFLTQEKRKETDYAALSPRRHD